MSKVTKSRMFAHWIAENYPELRINSLEDNRGSNHRHGQAVDISGIDNHEDKKKILKTALDLGLRIGRENKGKKGVGGWTGAHYHFDETGYKGDTDVHFIRGGKSGHANREHRTKEENKENDIFKAEMLKLKHEPSTIDEKSFKKTYEPKVKEYFKLMKDFKKDPKKVQKLIGTKVDGKFGKNTMRAMIDHTIGYKPFPSELLKKDNLVMADKKGDSFFKKLVQQEAQKEIKEKKKSYDDMKFSDAFEEAMKDKGEGEVFKYKGKDILLKRAEPEIKKEPVKEKSYDDMKFSDAFEQAMKDKGEGEVFKHRGRDILLKRAEPKVEEKKPMDFQSLVKEYASKEIEPVEELDQGYNMDNIKDSQRVELVDRENELEKLLKQRAAFAHGGRKYQDAGFGESIEEPESIDNKPTLRDPFAPKSLEAQDIKEDMELAAEEDKTMVDTDPDVLPEEPEDKPEALTMDTLEQRFKDLMKSSKKERQTAAWATAASQIASMIDRASANPIGIKPINFQAGDASAEAKDLLALGRMKGLGVDRSMTEYQKAALKERQEDRKLAREKLKALALKAPKQDLTEAEKAVDKAYAKEYSDYIAAGGSKTAESDINKLDELAKEMKDNKDIFTGPLDTAVEYLGGFDTVRAAVNPKLQDIKSRLEQIVQQDLRTTLGAQFTEKEGKQFLERSFDPKLGYEENKKRLDDFIKMVKSRANARMKSAKYFEDKGTLKGFKGTESVGESATSDTVLLEAPNGQRKRVKRSAMQKYLDKGAKVVGE